MEECLKKFSNLQDSFMKIAGIFPFPEILSDNDELSSDNDSSEIEELENG